MKMKLEEVRAKRGRVEGERVKKGWHRTWNALQKKKWAPPCSALLRPLFNSPEKSVPYEVAQKICPVDHNFVL